MIVLHGSRGLPRHCELSSSSSGEDRVTEEMRRFLGKRKPTRRLCLGFRTPSWRNDTARAHLAITENEETRYERLAQAPRRELFVGGLTSSSAHAGRSAAAQCASCKNTWLPATGRRCPRPSAALTMIRGRPGPARE